MEFNTPKFDKQTEQKLDISRVFGEDAKKLINQIAHDNPALSEDEVISYAWSLIPEATAYMQPAEPEDLAANAIDIYEGYEAFRRIQD
ncbi:MAG: hypothetical protein JWO54_906 [Candidatus Saccharibacteria bacterium]|nr:hypothetical protein [Candidatus Saccharibacteria bacterium]MDB5181143.1 hypothetical protein [Candidatus Saccharibacteria bacterium]